MWCGPAAAAMLINHFDKKALLTREDVWGHIYLDRIAKGVRKGKWAKYHGKYPIGGTSTDECVAVMKDAGLRVERDVFIVPQSMVGGGEERSLAWAHVGRLTVRKFISLYGGSAWYLTVSGHAFWHIPGQDAPENGRNMRRFVTGAWMVTPEPVIGA